METKVRPPPVREGTVHRPELVERLIGGPRRRLTLLSAPTGFGKTTLLAQWLASEDESRPFAWVNIDAADQDPMRLCAHLVEAIDRIEPGFGDGMRGVLETPGADLEGVVLPRLLNELVSLPRSVVVVFEDYHLLERRGPDNPTAFVLARLPEAAEFVVSIQTEPPIPLGRLRASGQLLEIRAPDLAFGEEEAGELLRTALGVELGPEEVKILTRRTEGWPAGLYLAALMLRGSPDYAGDIRSFAGSARFVADYLTEEVLDRQLPEVRRFLIRTSVLRRFDRLGLSGVDLSGAVSGGAVFGAIGTVLSGVTGFLSSLFLVLMIVLFLLSEGGAIMGRLRASTGADNPQVARLAVIGRCVVRQFGLRAVINFVTAVGITLLLLLLGVDFPLLWGVLAFFLSYVPYVGLVVATAPAVLLALAEFGFGRALLVVAGVVVVNMLAENVLSPTLMGRGLSLSPTIVFLSFIFWAWLLGGPGAFLALPLTLFVAVMLETFPETRWIAGVMGVSTGSTDGTADAPVTED